MLVDRIVALAGGVGGARFLRGLLAAAPDAEITVVGNTADDIALHGLHVSPDLDTVMYTLGGGIHEKQGWGRAEETFSVAEEFAAHGVRPDWFTLGDRDLATHIIRTQLLDAGYPLSAVTAALCTRWQPGVTLLPMTDDRVETHIVVDDPEPAPAADDQKEHGHRTRAIHFQEWWVRWHARLEPHRIVLVGIEASRPAPGVLEAIEAADVVLLPPSNPVVSIGPVLGVPGVRAALRDTRAPVVGVSPIVGGAPVRGMADACLRAIGVETSAAAVAGLYADLLSGWLVDISDDDAVVRVQREHDVPARAVPLLMRDLEATAEMAQAALTMAAEVSG